MLEESIFKLNDKVEFEIKGEKLTGIITAIHFNKRIIRVRVIKQGRRCWHEWMKPSQLILIDRSADK